MLHKKVVSCLAVASVTTLFMATSAYASLDGYYLGGMIGWGKVHTKILSAGDQQEAVADATSPYFVIVDSDNDNHNRSGWAGRLYLGYQLDCHWAAELGWDRFQNVESTGTALAVNSINGVPGYTTFNSGLSVNAIDLVAKYSMNVWRPGFNVFGKLGAAVVWENTYVNTSVQVFNIFYQNDQNHDQTRVFPTFGVGVSYDLTPTFVADVSYNRLQKVGGGSNLASTDMVTFGLAYHIG